MKSILFVMSSWWAGGTNGAMSSIIHSYDKEKWDVSIFLLSRTGKRSVPYDSYLLDNYPFLSAYYCNMREFVGFERCLYFLAKSIKKVTKLIGVNLEPFLFKRAVHRIEKKKQFDTVVAFIEGSVTRFGTYFNTKNKVAWIHCDYDKYLPKGRSEESIYSRYNSIITVSKYTSRVFVQRYPSLKDKVFTVYNLFDYNRVINLSAERVDDTRFVTDVFTIISVGRIHPVKRFRCIPKIASSLKQKGCIFRWYIIGSVFSEKERKAIVDNISFYNVSDYVFWLGGKSNPYPYFKSADLFVCTSYSEACPMVFHEARCVGTPIISTDFPSAYEFISDGKDGVITAIDNLDEALYRIMNDREYYNLLKKSCEDYHFNNCSLIKQMEQIL